MEGRRTGAVAFLVLSVMAVVAAAAFAADTAAVIAPGGWEESTPGRWNSLPEERRAVLRDNAIYGEFVLAPGTGIEWEKKGGWDNAAGPLSFEFAASGVNESSKDYKEFKEHFPVSLTAVFGEDSQDLAFKTRVGIFFKELWHGFSPGGIRLTYAFGNNVPVGSMYRLSEEETVFILAGPDDKGKKIQVKRDLRADFQAAYGRMPKGRLKRVILRAERPSAEKGPITCGILLTLP